MADDQDKKPKQSERTRAARAAIFNKPAKLPVSGSATKPGRPRPAVVESSEPEPVQSAEAPIVQSGESVVEAHDLASIDLSLPKSATETLKDALDSSANGRLAQAARYSATRTVEEQLAEIDNSTVGRAMREAEMVRRLSPDPYDGILDRATLDAQLEIDRMVEFGSGGLYMTDSERRLAEADRLAPQVNEYIETVINFPPERLPPSMVDSIIQAKHQSNMDAVLNRFDRDHFTAKPPLVPVERHQAHAIGYTDPTAEAAKAAAEREAREEARRERELALAEKAIRHDARSFWLTLILGLVGLGVTIGLTFWFGN